MAVISNRTSIVTFAGDVVATDIRVAAANANSPGGDQLLAITGPFVVTPPIAGATAVTIIPPTGNTVLITLKGTSGDSGIPLHKTDPTIIALDSSLVNFILQTASAITVRMIWS